MVEFVVTWNDIQPFVWTVFGVTSFLIFIKWRWTHVRAYAKKEEAKARKEKGLDGVIDRKLAEIPGKLKQVNAELTHLEKTGATEKQMKKLKDEKRLLELGRDYGEILAEVGKPIVKSLLSVVKGINI